MERITFEYFTQTDDGEQFFYIKTLDTCWSSTEGSYLFLETGESILTSSYTRLCFDLSNLVTITSSYLGIIMNLVTTAKKLNKLIKFKFGEECMDVIQLTALDKIAIVEEV